MHQTTVGGIYNATPPTLADNQSNWLRVDSQGLLITSRGSDGVTLTKAAVTMTGASGVLVAAEPTRAVVLVSNPAANATAAIDPTGGTAALTAGIPLGPGATIEITGKAAQSAMTQIGTNAQVLTVYTGT